MHHLVKTAAAWLAGRPEEACRRAGEALAVPRAERPVEPRDGGEVMRHLDTLLARPDESALMGPFREAHEAFRWRLPPADQVDRWLGGRSAGNVVVGPEGTFPEEKLRFGAFMIAPETVYPLHAHAAEELYIVIGGAGRWWIADAPYSPRRAGEVVHIPSWTPHAIRTGEDPLLTLWVWMGDVDFGAYRFEPAGFDADGRPI